MNNLISKDLIHPKTKEVLRRPTREEAVAAARVIEFILQSNEDLALRAGKNVIDILQLKPVPRTVGVISTTVGRRSTAGLARLIADLNLGAIRELYK